MFLKNQRKAKKNAAKMIDLANIDNELTLDTNAHEENGVHNGDQFHPNIELKDIHLQESNFKKKAQEYMTNANTNVFKISEDDEEDAI